MNNLFKYLLYSSLLMLAATASRAQGLEGIIVEEFHTITQADADAYNNTHGGGTYPLAAGMKAYRVYVDMAPNYELTSVFATPNSPLAFNTTTTFWNDDNWGSEGPGQTRRLDEGNLFDSFITMNIASTSSTGVTPCGGASHSIQWGVQRSADTDGDLYTCGVYPGFTGSDGHIPAPLVMDPLVFLGSINYQALLSDPVPAATFGFDNALWGYTGGITGVDPANSNIALIGQFTTSGDFSFQINVALIAPGGGAEEYVHTNPNDGQILSPLLTFPQACIAPVITSATSNSPICSNQTLDLSVVATGDGPLSYEWTGTGSITNGDQANASVTGAATGNYSVTVTNACGNTSTNVAVVVTPATTYYADTDGDGFGDPNGATQQACTAPTGFVANNTDNCPDDGLKQEPGACGCGVADVPTTYYADTDGDGFGDPATPQAGFTCIVPPGFVANSTDNCPEDGLKQEPGACGCGVADVATTYYADTDGDGFGDPAAPQAGFTCIVPPGFVANNTDNCPNLSGLIGDACDDENPNTSGDVITANCVCAGVLPNDCEGVPGGSAQPGTPCDDGLTITGNDTWNANCECVGELIDCEGIPGGTALPGTPCNDNNTATTNDIWSPSCVCEGTLLPVDCDGVPGGPAQPGTPCNDGDVCTINDVFDANCNCAGTFQDTDNDGTCDASDPCPVLANVVPGQSCDDGNSNTEGDVITADCICQGTPIGQCSDVTLMFKTDANASVQTAWVIRDANTNGIICQNTTPLLNNATFTANCCLGDGCYILEVTDDAGDGLIGGGFRLEDESGRRIIDNWNLAPMGSSVPNNPFGGADAFSMSSVTGFTAGVDVGQPYSFCLPVGTDRLITVSCDKTWWKEGDFVVANENPAVSAMFAGFANNSPQRQQSGYEFWFYDPNGLYSFRKFRNHSTGEGAGGGALRACHMRITPDMNVPEGMKLNVKVRGRVYDAEGNLTVFPWGAACRFVRDEAAASCPPTQLLNIPGNQFFTCGTTRTWANNSKVHANPVQGATQYQFRFRTEGEPGFEVVRTSSTYWIPLGWTNAPELSSGTYQVDVRAFRGGQWCAPEGQYPWGVICDLGIVNSGVQGGGVNSAMEPTAEMAKSPALTLWPNPGAGNELWMSIEGLPMETPGGEPITTVAVDILTLTGQRVEASVVPVSTPGAIYTQLDLRGSLAAGMYVVRVTAGDQMMSQRLVIAP